MKILLQYLNVERVELCKEPIRLDDSDKVSDLRESVTLVLTLEKLNGFCPDESFELRLDDILLPDQLSLRDCGFYPDCLVSVYRFLSPILVSLYSSQ